jgi:hypothetical protein
MKVQAFRYAEEGLRVLVHLSRGAVQSAFVNDVEIDHCFPRSACNVGFELPILLFKVEQSEGRCVTQ